MSGATFNVVTFMLIFLVSENFLWLAFPLVFLNGFSGTCAGMTSVLYAEVTSNDAKWYTYHTSTISLSWFFGSLFGGIFIDIMGVANLYIFVLIFSLLNTVLSIFIQENREEIIQINQKLSQEKKLEITLNADIKLRELKKNSPYLNTGLFFRSLGARPILVSLAIFFSFTLTSDSHIGFLISVNPLIQTFFSLIIGRLIKRQNFKFFLTIGYFLSTLAMVGYYFSTEFWGLLVSQVLVCVSYVLFWNATFIYINQNTTPTNKGRYVTVAVSFFYLGSFIGDILMGVVLLIRSDYYFAILIMMIFPSVSALVLLFGFRLKSKEV